MGSWELGPKPCPALYYTAQGARACLLSPLSGSVEGWELALGVAPKWRGWLPQPVCEGQGWVLS